MPSAQTATRALRVGALRLAGAARRAPLRACTTAAAPTPPLAAAARLTLPPAPRTTLHSLIQTALPRGLLAQPRAHIPLLVAAGGRRLFSVLPRPPPLWLLPHPPPATAALVCLVRHKTRGTKGSKGNPPTYPARRPKSLISGKTKAHKPRKFKLKTHQGAKKRFRRRADGEYVYGHIGKRHLQVGTRWTETRGESSAARAA